MDQAHDEPLLMDRLLKRMENQLRVDLEDKHKDMEEEERMKFEDRLPMIVETWMRTKVEKEVHGLPGKVRHAMEEKVIRAIVEHEGHAILENEDEMRAKAENRWHAMADDENEMREIVGSILEDMGNMDNYVKISGESLENTDGLEGMDEKDMNSGMADYDLLDIDREISRDAIKHSRVYNFDGTVRRERAQQVEGYLDGLNHHEASSLSGQGDHISFIPHLSGFWDDLSGGGAFDNHGEIEEPIYVFPSLDVARSEARGRAGHVIRDWKLLANIVERYEGTIQKRWAQKTREKRKEILLGAWPDIPMCHRPDFQDFKSKTKCRNKDAYLWPYMNIEDLTKPRLLPLFLNSRGRNEPNAFAEPDYVACRFGFPAKALTRARLHGYVMRFIGPDHQTPETYGGIYPKLCEGTPEVCAWEVAEDNVNPGAGLIMLEVQERVYSFLVNCCRLILHDIPENILGDPTVPTQPEPESFLESDTTLPPLAQVAAEAPYRLQLELDLRRLQSIVQGKLSAAEDHLWALREDPHCFASAFWEEANHSHQLVGKAIMLDSENWNRCFESESQKEYHAGIFARELVCHALKATEVWRDLEQQLDRVLRLREKICSTKVTRINIGRNLAEAVMKLEHDVEMYLSVPISRLERGFFSSPPVRLLLSKTESRLNYEDVAGGCGPRMDDVKDTATQELFWIVTSLWNKEQRRMKGWQEMYGRPDWQFGPIRTLADPSDGKFSYSIDSPGTPETIEATWKAEKHLDALWKEIDREFRQGKCRPICMRDLLANRILQRTPKPRIQLTKQEQRELQNNLSEIYFDREQRTERTIAPDKTTADAKIKPKTKGIARSAELEPVADNPPTPVRQDQLSSEQFTVDKRSLKTFRTLFYNPEKVSQPGEIAWANFLHAMTSIGFSVQKLYGSVWQFNPEKLQTSERPIQFHEPHPSGKLPFYLARHIGRRLTRAYGWLGENFASKK